MSDDFVYEEPPEIQIIITPRAQAAVDELQAMIAARYPEATFSVYTWYDTAGIYLEATIDIEDTDEVRDVFRDRLLDIQVEDGIPVDVRVSQPPERAWEQHLEYQERQARRILASLPDRIAQDPGVMSGAPVITGTLVSVESVLAHLASIADVEDVLSLYPEITIDDVRACLDFARTQVAAATRREAATEPAIR